MTHLFIINPAAGSRDRTGEYTREIEQVCRREGVTYRIHVSAGPGDCLAAARQAAQTGEAYRIYACGGDGTLNEVAAGAAGYGNAAVTHFAGGSGNDFVKIFSRPEDFFHLDRLIQGQETAFDMIRCNDDLALNIVSVGLDARIGTDVASYKRYPFLQGFRAYAASAVVNVIRGIGDHYIVEVNGERIDSRQTMVCICNGRYYGGGFNPVPEADPTDGILDVLLVKEVTRLQVPGVVGKYKNGRYRELPELVRRIRTDRMKIRCDSPAAINLDGELRKSSVLDISVEKKALRFFYPKGLTWAAPQPVAAGKGETV